MKRKEKGITLIALIITVIVMLILAGVVISLTIGDNGIFKRSDEGAKIYQNAVNNEVASLNDTEQEMGNLINQYGGSNKPFEREIYTENSTIDGKEPSAFNPEIPKGFRPVDVEDALWGDGSNPPTEEAVKKGLVIEDEEHNQFVWIAVDGIDVKLDRYTFANDGREIAQGEAVIDSYYQELASSDKGNTVAKNINEFKASVATHGGYYFARYEASYGLDKKPNSKVSTSFTTKRGEANAPTVEGQLWNNITQINAAKVCRNMYDSSYGATSDLVNSYAWDTAIVFIQRYSGDPDYSIQKSLNTTLANTGENGDEKCHIQDMASNGIEWTTETSSKDKSQCVKRGGFYNNNLLNPSKRLNTDTSTSSANEEIAFRPILYL